MITYSQNFEDVMLARALSDVKEGFYVDIGAWDPREHSVTFAFYEKGWRGVNVEPNPIYLERLNSERPSDVNLGVAVGECNGIQKFYIIGDTGLSTFDASVAQDHGIQRGYNVQEIDVNVVTLNEIFEK